MAQRVTLRGQVHSVAPHTDQRMCGSEDWASLHYLHSLEKCLTLAELMTHFAKISQMDERKSKKEKQRQLRREHGYDGKIKGLGARQTGRIWLSALSLESCKQRL